MQLSSAGTCGYMLPRGAVPGVVHKGEAPCPVKKHAVLVFSRPPQTRVLAPAWGGGGQLGCWLAPPPAPLSLALL